MDIEQNFRLTAATGRWGIKLKRVHMKDTTMQNKKYFFEGINVVPDCNTVP